MQPLTLIRRPALTQTLTSGAGGGAYSASFSSESGSAHPLTSTRAPPTEPHTVALACPAPSMVSPAAKTRIAHADDHIFTTSTPSWSSRTTSLLRARRPSVDCGSESALSWLNSCDPYVVAAVLRA